MIDKTPTIGEALAWRADLMTCIQCGNTRRYTNNFSVCPGLMHNHNRVQPPIPCTPRPPRPDIDREEVAAQLWIALDLLESAQAQLAEQQHLELGAALLLESVGDKAESEWPRLDRWLEAERERKAKTRPLAPERGES